MWESCIYITRLHRLVVESGDQPKSYVVQRKQHLLTEINLIFQKLFSWQGITDALAEFPLRLPPMQV
jgi:hypothetical protein